MGLFTLLFGCNFTGHTGDVTIETCPPSLALASVGRSLLPARSPVLAWGRITPAYQILKGHRGLN